MAASIHPTDILSVAFQDGGRSLVNLTMSGMASMGDVFRRVRSENYDAAGVVRVIVRNRTRGWAQQHTLVFKPALPVAAPSAPFVEYPSLF